MTTETIWSHGNFLALTQEQIEQLCMQHCSCPDWSKVRVAAGFNTERVRGTRFRGNIRLGRFEKVFSLPGNVEKSAGISNANIHNCIIGNNVYISGVRNHIANYCIDDDAFIENIDTLAVEGASSFGNGTEVAVVNEAGGREILIYDQLTAQIAYIIAFYRHRPKVISFFQESIAEYSRSVTSTIGLVGKSAVLTNCRILKNLKIGPACVIEAAVQLQNGSINSNPDDPVYIGPGVIAKDFIACSGARITDGTIISRCFIGQGTVLSKQFSAENSVFFANCSAYLGEACSIFAGPFTVTHHKSTLLIAGLFSFFNAGSGTNQSNHKYKTGPVHQGIVERGTKTASSSYMLWPARVGAFSVVVGRHYINFDTSDLPFSYLIEYQGNSILIPGVNLRSIGTARDAQKWPSRDIRKDPVKLDLINYSLLNPYTIQKMLTGLEVMKQLKQAQGDTTEYYDYKGLKITKDALNKGIRLYETGIYKFIGDCLVHRLQDKQIADTEQLRQILSPSKTSPVDKWSDLAGLLAPQQEVENLLNNIENAHIQTLRQVSETLENIHNNYTEYQWTWAVNIITEQLGKKAEQINPGDIIKLTNKWIESVTYLDNLLLQDAEKEFSSTSQAGYGLDGDENTRIQDFNAVRGDFENQLFVNEIKQHIESQTKLANELNSRMNEII